ncbi:concanavalin A-like lectin/glucanase domain-containing protein [Lasiosphaeria miniovina]|uniref:Concanavalin A-like lectin/glucanase domain-containing protein n=1 Tax=Lasiosphaeria miniovina TaxID=1954250 RepID=A0AA40BF11_9PEZI|nr:concanavalin A-like lectin/glucanase domain-containing protein [Lasiosphaeria miniovina]KAK0732999.1 concanavalin A-like lectin/glucanase domain-containing protein [Lasiosphaeria miniovina]
MRHNAALSFLSLFSSLAAATQIPGYPGFHSIWSDGFGGGAGQSPNGGQWTTVTNLHVNNEVEDYTMSNQNVQLSGGDTIQFVPHRNASGQWTSGRIESKATFTPQQGKVMMVESMIRFGDGPSDRQQGIWPAFWMLGDSIHHGTEWPRCGELDIMERINGQFTGYGTTHCGYSKSGGPCNEPNGRFETVAISDNGWHRWSLKIDLTNSDWRAQTIQWFYDGRGYHTLSGGTIGDAAIWGSLAHSPLFIIFNVAVGGDWPGPPNGATVDSWSSMMEVSYVAVYST